MTKADQYRKKLIESIVYNGVQENNRLSIAFNGETAVYSEIITLDEINAVNDSTVERYLNEFMVTRLQPILNEYGYDLDLENIDINSSDFYDGYSLNIPLVNERFDPMLELFNEIDSEMGVEPTRPQPKPTNKPTPKEPGDHQVKNLPTHAKANKTQNPKKVDSILKSVFDSKFKEYKVATDIGDWKAVKTLNKDGKLNITWESVNESSILIDTNIFPGDTNKVKILVKSRQGEILIDHYFEIYRIPTDEFLAEKFFRKTLFNLLKKFIDTSVIQIDPFRTEFVFWKTDNPNFSYSFSTPNKNKIVLDLISFISTAKKPILDDFFEQNNLKHKQGYLQTLLDSAEAAGIFRFKREGNEILILRGPNYKAFLEGKVRRVVS